MDSPRLSVHTLSLSGPSSLVFISFVPSLGPLTCRVEFVATYLLGCFIEAMLAAYMSGWWQCLSSLPTMLWHFAAFGASPNSLSTTSIGGLCVRMVAVLQLTTAHNASATYLLRCFFQQRQALVAYLSGWWQCFGSLLPTMLWRPTYFGASASSLSTTNIGGLCVRMVAVLQLTTANNASATYLLRCFFQQRQALVAFVSGWWQRLGSLLPTMLWRPTYFGTSANSLSTTSIGGLCVRMVAVLQLTTANNALATYLLRCFRELSQHNKYWWPLGQDGGSAWAHYCQQCFGNLPTSVLPLTLSAKASVGGLCVRMVAALRLTTANNALATYLLRCFRLLFQQREAMVVYATEEW